MRDSLNIVHVFRAPVGGLFRHVRDLVKLQSARGHQLGVICDSSTGGDAAGPLLEELQRCCSLGVHRFAMGRMPGLSDLTTARKVKQLCAGSAPDIIHGHGAKGGLYCRLAAKGVGAKAVYTPHGGILHFSWKTLKGALFLGAERVMLSRTDGLAFVCKYEQREFAAKVGMLGVPYNIIHNGLWPDEFVPAALSSDARDVVYVGEMRDLKGVDVLIEAIASIGEEQVSAVLVGDGPDREKFENLARQHGLAERVTFPGAMPASDAFALGELMVVPSRNESFPYVVIEAIAAQKPLVATRVGGIPEILEAGVLVAPGDAGALADVIRDFVVDRGKWRKQAEKRFRTAQNDLSAERMADRVLSFYGEITQ